MIRRADATRTNAGINIIINPHVDVPAQTSPLGGIDPTTGAPLPAAPPQERVNLNDVIFACTSATSVWLKSLTPFRKWLRRRSNIRSKIMR